MEVTDIRMRLVADRTDRLKAFCTVTFDEEFVVRDIKVVEGPDGFFIAMPSRKLSVACPSCRHKNQARARFCEECGKKLKPQQAPQDPESRTRLYRDIAHPITPAFREKLQTCIIDAYRVECDRLPDEEPHGESDGETDDVETVGADVGTDERMAETEDGEVVEVSGETDQYDALIADLKGGLRSETRAAGESSSSRDRVDSRRPRDDAGAREKRRRRKPRGHGERAARGDGDVPGQARSDAPAQSASTTRDDHRVPDAGSTVGEAGSNESRPRKALKPGSETADRVSLDDAAGDAAASADPAEDTETPFGAGIV